ncbi:MAG TPA: acylphosphatase [Flavobacteriales bacterium]|nr:acylphosphatase [Flavobacteriales bacterium]
MVQAKLRITGVVQGVFYRDSARDIANKLNLKGYAKNMADGSVESVVVGEKEKIEEYARWCEEGPASAQVELVELEWFNEVENFEGFEAY